VSEPAFSVEGVLDALAMQPRRGAGDGRAIMFIAARRKEGVTTAARAVAQAAGPGAIYAIDLDLKRNAFARELANIEPLGPKIDGRLNAASFYNVRGPNGMLLPERAPAFSYHRVGRTRIYAGVFDPRLLSEGGRVVISSAPHYWDAVRAGGAMAVVDAPALERSEIGLRVARNMDGVVLVVGSDRGAAPAAIAAKQGLIDAGANLMGIIYAGASAPVIAIERLMRQAG
jgi:hypothetical protein